MAFRATNAAPARRYEEAKNLATQMRNYAGVRAASFGSGADAAEVLATAQNLKTFRDKLAEISTTPGIAAYAQEQEDDVTYDVAAEFTAMLAAIDACVSQIVADMPDDGTYILAYSINPDGTLTPRNFTGAQLATTISTLTAVANSVS